MPMLINELKSKVKLLSSSDTNSKLIKEIEEIIDKIEVDITENKNYGKLFELANDGVIILDKKNIIRSVNKKYLQLFNRKDEDVLNQPLSKVVNPQMLDYVKQQTHKDEEILYKVSEFKYTLLDGKQIWCQVSTSPIYNDKNEYNGLIIIISAFLFSE